MNLYPRIHSLNLIRRLPQNRSRQRSRGYRDHPWLPRASHPAAVPEPPPALPETAAHTHAVFQLEISVVIFRVRKLPACQQIPFVARMDKMRAPLRYSLSCQRWIRSSTFCASSRVKGSAGTVLPCAQSAPREPPTRSAIRKVRESFSMLDSSSAPSLIPLQSTI